MTPTVQTNTLNQINPAIERNKQGPFASGHPNDPFNYYQNYTYDYRAKYGDGFYNFDKDSHLLKDLEITVNNVPIFKEICPIFS